MQAERVKPLRVSVATIEGVVASAVECASAGEAAPCREESQVACISCIRVLVGHITWP